MTYREAPIEPLVIVGSEGVMAFDPTDGTPIWSLPLPSSVYTRVALCGDAVVVARGRELRVLDRRTGVVRRQLDLDHAVQSLVSDGVSVVAMGSDGLVCLRDGQVVWSVRDASDSRGWLSVRADARFAVCDSTGQPRTPLPGWVGGSVSSSAGMILGRVVAQTDRDT